MQKKRCVIVGAGGRGTRSYALPIANGHLSDACQLVGIYDKVKARAVLCSQDTGGTPVFDSFEEMLDSCHPDFVIVTTKDADHHTYIIKALEMGYDVVSEKPMTDTRKKAKEIIEAEKRTGHKVRVTFNMRYMKPIMDLKRVMMSGAVGEVRHVDFEWLLDRDHGADYFRRWHRYLANTNSLLLHKSTHHFDVANWVIGNKIPKSVFARCTLDYYGKNGALRGECCHKCSHAKECPLYVDFSKDSFAKRYYFDIEEESGYYRDGCPFAEDIDIFDRMALNVKYEDGTTMNYSLVAYSPDEGFRIRIVGTKGRLDFEKYSSGPRKDEKMLIRVIDTEGKETITETAWETGDHGGADDKMRDDIFRGRLEPDILGQFADSTAGFNSLAIGDMAVMSSRLGREVSIDEI